MKKLKVLFYGNIFSNSGGTKSFSILKNSQLIDLYFGAPIIGSLYQYDISEDKIIILPTRDCFGPVVDSNIIELTKDIDIVIDVCDGIPYDKPYKSILYHTNSPIKIMHTAFNSDISRKSPQLNIDAYFSCSLDMMRDFKLYDEFNKNMFCLYCIQEPIKVTLEKRNEVRKRFNIPEDSFLIGSTCGDDTLNRYVVTEFIKKYPNVYFLTTSSYGETDRFGCVGIPENFRSIGPVDAKYVESLLSSFDVLIHTRTETFGSCVYEALAAGIPVVARWSSSNNGYAECIYPHGGYLCGPGDDDVFLSAKCCVDALEHVYKNYNEALDRAKIAKNRVSRWYPENIVPQYEKLFASIALNKGILSLNDLEKYISIKTSPDIKDLLDWSNITRVEIEKKLLNNSFI